MTVNSKQRNIKKIGFPVILLSALIIFNCTPFWQFVRRGTKIDEIELTLNKLDSLNRRQLQLLNESNADVLTEIERLQNEINQLSAKLDDQQENLQRLYQRLGITRNERISPDTLKTSITTQSESIEPDNLYNTAYLDYTQGNYDVAIAGFQRYLKLFPDTELSDNAQYWIGECYYSQKLYSDAILEFEKVITNYPNGNKVVSALYKIGLAYEANNEIPKAKQYYQRVMNQFPQTNEAKLARTRYQALP